MHTFLKGVHYTSPVFYSLQTLLKLRFNVTRRFSLARTYIPRGSTVLDLCAGFGQFQKYVPEGTTYCAVEASSNFISVMQRKGIAYIQHNLHTGIPQIIQGADVVVMIISLCHFRSTRVDQLLEEMKVMGKKVVIVEDVLEKKRSEHSLLQRMMHYFCSSDFYVPMELFTREEFGELMESHGYRVVAEKRPYMVGVYE